MGTADAEILRINVQFPVEGRRGNAPLGMEAQAVALAPVQIQAVDQVIIVERMPVGGSRRRHVEVEQGDGALVEIGFEQVRPRILAHEVIRINARDAVGQDHLLLERRIARMILL